MEQIRGQKMYLGFGFKSKKINDCEKKTLLKY